MASGRLAFDRAMLAACALFPALIAALGADDVALASHDGDVVRAVGLASTGWFRSLDAIVSSAAMLLPVGTRALRAGLASALVAGACGAVAYVLARDFVRLVLPGASAKLLQAVAAVAVLTALLGPAWQDEASAPGGAVVGALLVLGCMQNASLRWTALILGLGASYEPFVFVASLLAAVPRVYGKKLDLALALPFAVGLAPIGLHFALAYRAPELALAGTPLALRAPEALRPFLVAEVGWPMLLCAAGGIVLGARVPAARRAVISLGLVALASALRSPAASLAALVAVHALAAASLAFLVTAIAKVKVPFAAASAALVVVLELALPVHAADETFSRQLARAPRATVAWDEVAWGPAPAAAIVLVSDAQTTARVASARATGSMRDDLLVVSTLDVRTRGALRALAAEPKLAPLYRDMALAMTPQELSLSQLAAERPLLLTFDPRWDRALARHLVPVGLVAQFDPEPRGASDRKKALDDQEPSEARLVRVAVARKDKTLASVTASLLRSRAIAMAACNERDVLSRALDDLRPFAPDDPVASTLVRRIVTSKGPIEVKDLGPR